MIDRAAVKKWKPVKREAICSHLAWWRNVKSIMEPQALLLIAGNIRAAFYYEAEARIKAQESGKYEWAEGKPLNELAGDAVLRWKKSIPTLDRLGGSITISGKPKEMPDGWSCWMSFNISYPDKVIRDSLMEFIRSERERLGVRKQPRSDLQLFAGLDAFDAEFIRGEKLLEPERKRKATAIAAYRKFRATLER